MEIETSGGEIVGILTKMKTADPADSHHASLDAAKKQDIVKQDIVTVTILTNLRRSEAEKKGRGRDGDGECDAGVRRSRARPHRLHAVVGAVRPRRAL